MTTTDNGAPRNLAAMRLPELRKLAADLGLKGVSALRKGALIAAITNASGDSPAPAADANAAKPRQTRTPRRKDTKPVDDAPAAEADNALEASEDHKPRRRRATRTEHPGDGRAGDDTADTNTTSEDTHDGDTEGETRYESRSAQRRARRNRARREERENRGDRNERRQHSRTDADDANTSDNATTSGDADTEADSGDNHDRFDRGSDRTDRNDRNQRYDRNDRNDRNDRDDDRRGRRGRRNRRGRDRDNDNYDNDNRNDNRDNQNSRDNRDDQLQVVAGILDVVDNNVAFVRTSGYHAGPADVYVNSQMVRRLGLRSGDAITGSVRMTDTNDRYNNNRGRNRQKYNPLARVDSVNGMTVEEAKNRPEFNKLTPLYPNQRIRLETEPGILTTRVIDLIMPIGKGQRALTVSPPKAGKTTILQNIANAIATNRPECYLMVVLVDERPEEVTDMQRSVKGEVIASTFDRPPAEHTAVAELAIERAKRLVEQGQDVVVLLDSITRLGRAYNNSSPASGRILSGGVDSNALYPPKRFLGAARNIENGGSLTIIATAMVETGSAGDTVIFEEFKGTGNAELKLDRKIAERRVFPAVDIGPSGTRKDELLLAPEEARVMHKLRGILSVLDNQQAIDTLIAQLKKYKTNGEFLAQVAAQRAFMSNGED